MAPGAYNVLRVLVAAYATIFSQKIANMNFYIFMLSFNFPMSQLVGDEGKKFRKKN